MMATRDFGESLAIVVCGSNMPVQHIDIVNVGLSDHLLLRRSVPTVLETTMYPVIAAM